MSEFIFPFYSSFYLISMIKKIGTANKFWSKEFQWTEKKKCHSNKYNENLAIEKIRYENDNFQIATCSQRDRFTEYIVVPFALHAGTYYKY